MELTALNSAKFRPLMGNIRVFLCTKRRLFGDLIRALLVLGNLYFTSSILSDQPIISFGHHLSLLPHLTSLLWMGQLKARASSLEDQAW